MQQSFRIWIRNQKIKIHSPLLSGLPVGYQAAETITIQFAGWISSRIVSLQPYRDIQKLLSNRNGIRIRISETLFSIFREFRILEKVAHCTIIQLASFQLSVPWIQVCHLSIVKSQYRSVVPCPIDWTCKICMHESVACAARWGSFNIHCGCCLLRTWTRLTKVGLLWSVV